MGFFRKIIFIRLAFDILLNKNSIKGPRDLWGSPQCHLRLEAGLGRQLRGGGGQPKKVAFYRGNQKLNPLFDFDVFAHFGIGRHLGDCLQTIEGYLRPLEAVRGHQRDLTRIGARIIAKRFN